MIFSNCGRVAIGPDLGIGERRIAQLGGANEGDQLLEELVVDAPLQQETRARLATLAGRRENPRDDTLDSLIEIGIVEHDVGRLAAELERDGLESRCRELIDLAPRGIAAGEPDMRDRRDARRAPRPPRAPVR